MQHALVCSPARYLLSDLAQYPVVLLEDAHTTCGNAAVTPRQVIAHHNITLSSTSSFGSRARLQTAQQWADSVSQA